MSIKIVVLGEVFFWVWGGGSADFIFMGAGIFLKVVLLAALICICNRS